MVSEFQPAVTSDTIIDLSHWNCQVPVDFHAVNRAGILACFLKASEGAHPQGHDPLYKHNLAAAQDAGIMVAPYHFLTHEAAEPQFDNLMAIAELVPGMVVMLDFERPHVPADIVAELGHMVASATGRVPIIYTGRYMLPEPHPVLSQWPLMLAEYGSHPVCPPGWSQWLIHQYTDHGDVAGIHGHVDRSVFAGTESDLISWWLGAMPIAVPAPPPAHEPPSAEDHPHNQTVAAEPEMSEADDLNHAELEEIER